MTNPKPVPTRAITVLEPGARVTLNGVPAMITALQIWDDCRVNYHVVWWDGRNRRAEWVDPCEVQAGETPVVRVGFRSD